MSGGSFPSTPTFLNVKTPERKSSTFMLSGYAENDMNSWKLNAFRMTWWCH